MSQDNEQYRAGFEAYARDRMCDLEQDECGGYISQETQIGWDAWTASKLEASTEPSAKVESLRAALRSVNAVAIERGDKYGACDQIDNDGQPYQSEWFAKLLAGQSAGALTDDAKDAARYRWLRACGGEWSGLSFLDIRGDIDPEALDSEIDAAIETHTRAGSGK